jgi:signal transduction histidine kinase
MRRKFRLPLVVIAAALFGLIVLLATLQYRWLGQISNAERERMKATLNTRAAAFAQDFDREITRAYLLFQLDPLQEGESPGTRIAARYDRWQATARFPRMVKDVFIVVPDSEDNAPLQRFNASTRFVEPAEWPEALTPIRAQLTSRQQISNDKGDKNTILVHAIAPALWENIPALVVPTPRLTFNQQGVRTDFRLPLLSYAIVVLDREYLMSEMLTALAQQHFRGTGDGFDYQLAVVSAAGRGVVYHTAQDFSPAPDAKADAAIDLFQIRVQEFGALAAEVRRFATFTTTVQPPGAKADGKTSPPAWTPDSRVVREILTAQPGSSFAFRDTAPLSIVIQQSGPNAPDKTFVAAGAAAAALKPASAIAAPKWRLVVKHPSGSLEGAVAVARRRNLIVSSSILAVLGVSLGLLVVSTRRAQELARQQMEFVAAVSHELRTPLAVIRSAADNLADGVVDDQSQIRKYGELVRGEGRRLTEMVEQILEFAGIQSGQRGLALQPVAVEPLLREVVAASASLIEAAGLDVDFAIDEKLPPVRADEPALRRVFQNLIGNAIKYGASGRWIGVRARTRGSEVVVTVADRGIGIAPADQAHIFEPFYRAPSAIAAQIQGAGLGLSLVERIVEAHGGRVEVKSAAGSGSEFIVHLPAAAEERLKSDEPFRAAHAARSS